LVILDDDFEIAFENENVKTSTYGQERLITEDEMNDYENEVKEMLYWDLKNEDSDDYIRPDEEIMITPSTKSNHMFINYQNALNQQQADSIEKPLKRISKLSKIVYCWCFNFLGSMLDSDHKSEYQKSSSFMIPKIELSLLNDHQNTGRPTTYLPALSKDYRKEINDKENKNYNRVGGNNDQLATFHSRSRSHRVDSELKLEDLEGPTKTNRQRVLNMDFTSDFGWGVTDFSWQVKIEDKQLADKQAKEVLKWKKAYLQEKQNHKMRQTVLDQALAMSMRLLTELKTLDVKYYEEKEKNKALMSELNAKSNQNHKEIWDRGSNSSPSRPNPEEPSGSYSAFIRKSTEEIENIIRRIQFDSDKKKKSAEKPPQAPKVKPN
jgi:hypothetical protein